MINKGCKARNFKYEGRERSVLENDACEDIGVRDELHKVKVEEFEKDKTQTGDGWM